jgi:hypothetical protein
MFVWIWRADSASVKCVSPKVRQRLQTIDVWNSRMFVICRMNLVCIHPNLQYYCTSIPIRHVAREVEGEAENIHRGHANGQVKSKINVGCSQESHHQWKASDKSRAIAKTHNHPHTTRGTDPGGRKTDKNTTHSDNIAMKKRAGVFNTSPICNIFAHVSRKHTQLR